MSRRWIGVAAVAVLLLIGFAWLRHLAQEPVVPAPMQILAQIRRGQQAAEARNVGALMRLVSPHYKDENGSTRQILGLQAREQLRDAQQIDVTIDQNNLRIQVDPDGRHATSRGQIELRIVNSQGGTEPLVLNPVLHWRKERVRRYLIFHAEEWRVVRAEGIESGE